MPKLRTKKRNQEDRVLEGVVKRHPDGFGFFIPDNPKWPDIYIPRNHMLGIMSNDRVVVEAWPEKGGDRYRGKILRVVSRAFRRVTGQIHKMNEGHAVLLDGSHAWGADLIVDISKTEVKPNDWVIVDILSYPDSPDGFCGKVAHVIGDGLDPQNDAKRVLFSHNIPFEFSSAALSEAGRMPKEVSEQDMRHRQDLRNLSFVTIDGATAKDFDDAIFVSTDEKGFHLFVAIADVSHYVKEDSAIDQDAYLRGTSTYFPNFVAPMLPEQLSNELCSLKPNVPRLALVAEMRLNFQGHLEQSKFYEAVIESKARVTYGEAQEIIEGHVPTRLQHVSEMILKAKDLAKILMAKRFREGSLDLEIPETEIELDETGQPVDIIKSERLFAHRLIEELMLVANVAVAKFFTANDIAALYRIHEPPTEEALQTLESFLSTFGFASRLRGTGLQKKITAALAKFSGHPKEHILHILTLRAMMQAKYSPHNVGHFGLGFDDYVHFTSPIRRYPDLVVHRLLKARLMPHKSYRFKSLEELETQGSFLSACEQRSVKAERQFQAIKKARFIKQFIGQEFEGFVSSVTRFGVFVLLRQFDVDGLIRLEDLGGDRFEFDEEHLRLVGKKTGITYSIGEPLRVQVAAADTDLGRIDFVLSGEATHAHKIGAAENKTAQKRRKAKKDRGRLRKSRVSKSRRKGKAR